jgi:hypothetical protein
MNRSESHRRAPALRLAVLPGIVATGGDFQYAARSEADPLTGNRQLCGERTTSFSSAHPVQRLTAHPVMCLILLGLAAPRVQFAEAFHRI